MKQTSFILSALVVLFGCSNAAQSGHSENAIVNTASQDKVEQRSSQVTLPDSASAFIRQYFAPAEVQRVTNKKAPTATGTFYEVTLMNGTGIDFGKAGNWIEAKADEPNRLPTGFFPQAIQTYLESNFAGVGVESIDKENKGYELELTNDVNLYFDADGSFIRQEK
ncbi:PepSY-like domain-containing protein [Parapedobacter lycopersici]|uniref:PepSY-like domain-containing protein n=1 Tax=Parapedobacter lycopersici TaxID=1864939 RepID=UPI00214D785B|nr:PepSY-like domain-containing protein [Parapedobacter lycopersici]